MNILIIGSGLSGAVIAHKAAKSGKKVLILERRDHVGGNIYDYQESNGQLVQKYGPHIWHTDNEVVNKFMSSFWTLNSFRNIVEGKIKNSLVPIPFNFKGIEKFWPEKSETIKTKLITKYGKDSRISILDLLNQDDEDLKDVANFVYKNIFENYTTKMWGIGPNEIDSSVMKRVPVVIGYEDKYFSNKYEGIPTDGFSAAIEKMVDHPNIEIRYGVDANKVIEKKGTSLYFEDKEITVPIIFTGQIDEFFNNEFGILDYRSLNIVFEKMHVKNYQSTAVVNYPADKEMTRITEYKHFYKQNTDNTFISREYPGAYDPSSKKFSTPYYPMATDDARKKYEKYLGLADSYNNLHLVGRLATYKYLNMDQTVEKALNKWEEIK